MQDSQGDNYPCATRPGIWDQLWKVGARAFQVGGASGLCLELRRHDHLAATRQAQENLRKNPADAGQRRVHGRGTALITRDAGKRQD